jgi:hypothetical protein
MLVFDLLLVSLISSMTLITSVMVFCYAGMNRENMLILISSVYWDDFGIWYFVMSVWIFLIFSWWEHWCYERLYCLEHSTGMVLNISTRYVSPHKNLVLWTYAALLVSWRYVSGISISMLRVYDEMIESDLLWYYVEIYNRVLY